MGRKAIVIKPSDFENLVNLENKVQIMMGEYAKSEDFSNLLNNNNEEVLRQLSEVLTSLGKLQKQVDYLESHPECAICFHNVMHIYGIIFFNDIYLPPKIILLCFKYERIHDKKQLLPTYFALEKSFLYKEKE